MFDITHIIWLVSFFVVYGMKSMWIPWLWPVFNQIFLMVYLSSWIRKSNVLTGAEWIKTRFGNDKGSELSSLSVVIFALVSVIGFISYAFKGIGKFAVEFLPWHFSPDIYALIFMGITTIYVIAGGMYSVVLTDVLQFLVLTVGSFIVGFIAIKNVSPEMIFAVVPKGWESIFSGWHLNLDWTGLLNSANAKIASDGYSLFYIFIMMMLFKGLLVSMAGAAPNYDMQRILATKSPKEASLMSGVVTLLLGFPRYFMVAGISILALVFFSPQFNAMGSKMDFESVLPFVINNYIPAGLTGLLIAGLIAAFMSTFDSTVNAGAAYITNDIYKKYIHKNGSDKNYVFAGYIASLIVVIAGIYLGFHLESIDEITQWLFAALFTGYAIPNMLKWHWWRFNGFGYFWGMIGGIIGAIIIPNIFNSLSPLQAFPFISIVSFIGCIAGTLLTKQQPMEELISFYKQVKPWGFWKPVYEEIRKEEPEFKRNMQSKRDLFNVAVGIVWQFSFMALPACIILRMGTEIFILLLIVAITSYVLKKNWYDKIEDE